MSLGTGDKVVTQYSPSLTQFRVNCRRHTTKQTLIIEYSDTVTGQPGAHGPVVCSIQLSLGFAAFQKIITTTIYEVPTMCQALHLA